MLATLRQPPPPTMSGGFAQRPLPSSHPQASTSLSSRTFAAPRGSQMLRYKQSSEGGANFVVDPVLCMHEALYFVAPRVPFHGARRCGGSHRSGPTGGVAKGTPRKCEPDRSACAW